MNPRRWFYIQGLHAKAMGKRFVHHNATFLHMLTSNLVAATSNIRGTWRFPSTIARGGLSSTITLTGFCTPRTWRRHPQRYLCL